MQVKTRVKAGGDYLNHNQTLVRDPGPRQPLKVKTQVKLKWRPSPRAIFFFFFFLKKKKVFPIITRRWCVTWQNRGKSSQAWRGAWHARLQRGPAPACADVVSGRREGDACHVTSSQYGCSSCLEWGRTARRSACASVVQADAVVPRNRAQVFLRRRVRCSPSCCPSRVAPQCVCASHMAMSNLRKEYPPCRPSISSGLA